MKYSIRQTDTGWELIDADGGVVLSTDHVDGYGLMLSGLAAKMRLAADDGGDGDDGPGDGLLPEPWVSDAGIAFSELLGSGRDFTDTEWSWRDPATSMVPLMLMTATDYGHIGAEIAGLVSTFTLSDGTVAAGGRFFDSDAGTQLRDMMLGGRRMGVSVDPSENIDVSIECDEVDDYGWCSAERIVFNAYEIAGLTACPIPAFENASIILEGSGVNASAHTRELAALAAGGSPMAPAQPPRNWFEMAEPTLGDPRLIEQPHEPGEGGVFAVPLTIADDGQVFGHLAAKGQCHVGFADTCVPVPTSPTGYARFHVMSTQCDDGSSIPTGVLVAGGTHSKPHLSVDELRSFHEDVALAWADVRIVDGVFGPWMCGALRPDVTEDMRRVLRASTPSGEWRDEGQGLDLILAKQVNSPGFPIMREPISLAAGGASVTLPMLSGPRARIVAGKVVALTASGVARCTDCQKGAAASRRGGGTASGAITPGQFAELMSMVKAIDVRTRHLNADAGAALKGELADLIS